MENREEYDRTLAILKKYPHILEAGALQLFSARSKLGSAAEAYVAWTQLPAEKRLYWKEEIVNHIKMLRDLSPEELEIIDSMGGVDELGEDEPDNPWESTEEPWKS